MALAELLLHILNRIAKYLQNGGIQVANFGSFSGTITAIDDFWTEDEGAKGCSKFISVQNQEGAVVNFVATPATYFVDHAMVAVGDSVTGFYDADAPAILIYPPQYPAVVMARNTRNQNVKVAFFDRQLVSSDGTLKLILGPSTRIMLENGQAFTGNPANRNLIVVYGAATLSIPAQTIPYQIVVICGMR